MEETSNLPSEEIEAKWLDVRIQPFESDVISGKWIFGVPRSQVDKIWVKIAKAVSGGSLGPCARVTTAKASGHPSTAHTIVVFNMDHRDEDEIEKIRVRLRLLGAKGDMRYRRCEAPASPVYGEPNDQKSDKYRGV